MISRVTELETSGQTVMAQK